MSENCMPKVTFVMTTFNSKDNCRASLESITAQDYPNLEVVVKDGGSTDGTLEELEKWSSKYSWISYVTKPDTGIYDAMNQGYELSTGDLLVFFNDRLSHPKVVSHMVEKIQSDPTCVGGHADLAYKDGDRIVRTWHMGEGKLWQGWMPGHPTLYVKREMIEKYGAFDQSFPIAADYEFMVRFLKDKENHLVYLPEVIVDMFYGGTSNQDGFKTYVKSFREAHLALRKNKVPFALFICGFRTIRVLLQFVDAKGKNERV